MENKKKRWIKKTLVILIFAALVITTTPGCQKKDTSQPSQQETLSGKKTSPDISSQLNHMTAYVKKQYENGDRYFAVTDLDQNGRLELICSTGCQGSGQFTRSTLYQINTSGSNLEKCTTGWKDSQSQPDIVNGINTVYHNTKTGKYHYITQDYAETGSASNERTEIQALTLKDNCITVEALGYRKGTRHKKKKKRIYRHVRITKKKKELEILPDDFNEDYLADLKYGQLEKTSVNIGWFQIKEENTQTLTSGQIDSQLEKSCQSFTHGYFLKQDTLSFDYERLELDKEIRVPQLVDMPDSGKEDRLNRLIREKVKNLFRWVDEDEDFPDDFRYAVWSFQCTVKYAGTDRLSLLIQYQGYGKGGVHPVSVARVINLNLDQEEVIPKKEILPERYRKKAGQLIINGTCRDITQGSAFRETQKKYHNINPLKEKEDWEGIDFYFTKDSVGVVVATFHGIGDYAVYEVPRAHYET